MHSTTPPIGRSRRHVLLGALAAIVAVATSTAAAQPLFDHPLRIIVLGTPGATADLLARVVGQAMSQSIGQPVIVDNKPGAGGAVGVEAFLNAPNDGYTYLLSVSSLVSELPYTVKPRYDPFKAIKPLVELGSAGLLLVGDANLPPRNYPEFLAYVKANRGKINYASYSPGTLSHVLGLQLNQLAGLDMNHVGYKGSTPALQDVMGGSVQFMLDGPVSSIPMIKAGKIRAFAISSPQRSEALPQVPTFAELGLGEMTRTSWMGLWTTPNAPDAFQQRIREEALKALALPSVRERLSSLGLAFDTKTPRTPEQMSKSLREDYESVGKLLRSVNYRPE